MGGRCLFCGNENLKYKYPEYNNKPDELLHLFTECDCDKDGWLYDGYLYPWGRRNYLCSLYNGVEGLNVKLYKKGQKIKIQTVRGKSRECIVKSVFELKNIMIIQDGRQFLFLIDANEIEDAYDAKVIREVYQIVNGVEFK